MHLVAVLVVVLTLLVQGSSPVKNTDFEEGALGAPPPGWFVPAPVAAAGYTAVVSDESPATGTKCAVLASSKPVSNGFGNLMQAFDATPYRGQRVTYRARVRVNPGSRGQMWLRVDRAAGVMGAFDNMGDRPILSSTWSEYRIEADVAGDATSISVGVMLPGEGRLWFDSAVLEFKKIDTGPIEPPRALAGRSLDNLVAFTRLFGYVRYFHPSDEAASTDWDRFAIDGVRAVEAAATPQELASTLGKLFRPVAPTVRVFAGGKPVALPSEQAKPASSTARLTLWKHTGVGLGQKQPQIYSSVREVRDAVGPEADPAQPVTLDLGAGVTASVPTALWTDGGNTLPRQPAAVQPNPRSTTAADRATRIADVVIAWNIFQHFYPYFDVVPVNWPAVLRDYLPQAATSDENRFLQVLQQFVATLQDGHGGVNGGGAPGAFLPFAWEWIQDSLVVTHADGQEIQRGDVVTMVDGRPAAMAIADKERMVSSATPQWRRYRALMELTMGPLNSEVVLQVRTGDGPSREVRVRRAGRLVREPKPEVVQELRPGVFYVDIDRTTTEQWQKALPSLAAASAVIFDLRGYPRATPVFIQHIITTPVQSARWQVPVVTRPDRQGVTYLESGRWNLQPLTPQIKGKLAFVTDGRAISYAESCLGIIEHYKLAEIVGGPTAGTNGNVNPFQLPGGYSVAWTGMRVLKHDGSRHHGVGILPTIPASRTIAGVAAGRDELLERAIEAVTR